MIRHGNTPVREAIIHCSATRPDWMKDKSVNEKAAEIKRWHTDPKSEGGRGWSDIGYHRIIDRDGSIAVGRSLYRTGAHTRGKNRGTIGICLIGGHGSSETDDFLENFTPAQRDALRLYLNELQDLTPINKVTGHNQYAAKACPGFRVKTEDWL